MDNTPQQLVALGKKLRAELEAIKHALLSLHDDLQTQNYEIGKAHKASDEKQKMRQEVIAEAHLPEGVEVHKSTADAREDKKHQRHSLVVQWLTLIALVVYAAITGYIYLATRNAAQAARDSANAASAAAKTAKDTLTATENSFQADQRPYVIATTPAFVAFGPDAPIKANEAVKNIGKTPAIKMWWSVRLLPFTSVGNNIPKTQERFRAFLSGIFSDLGKKNDVARKELTDPGNPGGHDVAPSDTIFTTNTNTLILTAPQFASVAKGDIALVYAGLISYTDAFNGYYRTDFCYYFTDADPKVWHVCDAYNHIR